MSGPSGEWLEPGKVRRPQVTVGKLGAETPIGSFQYLEDTPTTGVAISPDLNMLAITSWGLVSKPVEGVHGKFELWDLTAGNLFFSYKSEGSSWGEGSSLGSCTFSPDGKNVVFSDRSSRYKRQLFGDEIFNVRESYQGDILLWEVSQKKQMLRLRIDNRNAGQVAFSPDGKTLVSGGATLAKYGFDSYLTWWNLSQGEGLGELHLERPRGKFFGKLGDPVIAKLAYHPSGHVLAVATGNESRGGSWGEVRLIETKTRDVVKTVWQKHRYIVLQVAFSHDGKWLAASTRDGVLMIWKVTDGD